MSLTSACATSRFPEPKTAQHATVKYLKKYGKKYPDSEFGNNQFKTVTIYKTQEVSRNVSVSQVVMEFSDGRQVPALVTMERRFPRSWFVTSWEQLGLQ